MGPGVAQGLGGDSNALFSLLRASPGPRHARYSDSMAYRVYIDGHAGTTGLRIREWLADRDDLVLATLTDADRKDPAARREQLRDADVAVLCLPDDAAREADSAAPCSNAQEITKKQLYKSL